MKAGTTSLYRWLGNVPGVALPGVKEPNYFSHEEQWRKGWCWYESLFNTIPIASVTGEASVSYSDPDTASTASRRISQMIPDARLIFLVREPIARIRSHYRHEVQRHRESRPFQEVMADRQNPYIGRSLYFAGLQPYTRLFPPSQIRVIRSEDLSPPDYPGWRSALEHLHLPDAEPGSSQNSTQTKQQFTRFALGLWEAGHLQRIEQVAPKPIRRLGRAIFMRRGKDYEYLLASAEEQVPDYLVKTVTEDTMQLEYWLGSGALWPNGNDR